MLGEESQVYPNKHHKKLAFYQKIVQGYASDSRSPKGHPRENREDSAHGQHVVKMRHDVICVV